MYDNTGEGEDDNTKRMEQDFWEIWDLSLALPVLL